MTPPSDARAAAPHETIFSTPSDRELVITRTFDAPRALVWEVFTDPKHLPKWQTGPEGFTMPACEIDLRPGGSFTYTWRNPQGREFNAGGTYREVDPPERLVFVTGYGGDEQTNTITFSEENGRTTVTNAMRFATTELRDRGLPYAKVGTEPNYARLDAYLSSLQRSVV